jgi:hypothetical protein
MSWVAVGYEGRGVGKHQMIEKQNLTANQQW